MDNSYGGTKMMHYEFLGHISAMPWGTVDDITQVEKEFKQTMLDEVCMAAWWECCHRVERFSQMIR
jgi:hypothetical protein